MKLIINGSETEYNLGDEQLMAEFFSSLKKYLAREKYTILRLAADGVDYTTTPDKLNQQRVEDVRELEVDVQNTTELLKETHDSLIEHVNRLIQHCSKLLRAYATRAEEFKSMVADVREGLEVITQVFESSIVILGLNPEVERFENEPLRAWAAGLATFRRNFDEVMASNSRERILGFIAKDLPFMLARVKGLFTWLQNQDRSAPQRAEIIARLRGFGKILTEKTGDFEQIATCFQTGEKFKGMEKLIGLIDAIQDAIRELRYLDNIDTIIFSDGQTYNQFIVAATEKLSEIVDVFEREDMVLLSDLVEYELSVIVKRLLELIEKIGS